LGRKWECLDHGNCDCGSDILFDGGGDDDVLDSFDEITTYKLDAELKDQQSTGRKRAAKLYPLDAMAACEWQKKKHCGGGATPIVGCINGLQQARHHGPDKNTLNNERGNVHRICHNCNNRWHALNDKDYVWGATYPSHSPVEATVQELAASEFEWFQKGKLKKAVD